MCSKRVYKVFFNHIHIFSPKILWLLLHFSYFLHDNNNKKKPGINKLHFIILFLFVIVSHPMIWKQETSRQSHSTPGNIHFIRYALCGDDFGDNKIHFHETGWSITIYLPTLSQQSKCILRSARLIKYAGLLISRPDRSALILPQHFQDSLREDWR